MMIEIGLSQLKSDNNNANKVFRFDLLIDLLKSISPSLSSSSPLSSSDATYYHHMIAFAVLSCLRNKDIIYYYRDNSNNNHINAAFHIIKVTIFSKNTQST